MTNQYSKNATPYIGTPNLVGNINGRYRCNHQLKSGIILVFIHNMKRGFHIVQPYLFF
jgi:hypothetical protein